MMMSGLVRVCLSDFESDLGKSMDCSKLLNFSIEPPRPNLMKDAPMLLRLSLESGSSELSSKVLFKRYPYSLLGIFESLLTLFDERCTPEVKMQLQVTIIPYNNARAICKILRNQSFH